MQVKKGLKDLLTNAPILKIENPNEDLFCTQMHVKKGLVESLQKMSI
jgi:hypothetical protein